MARPPRFQAPGAMYHITSRGAEGRTVFLDGLDRGVFLEMLASVVQDLAWLCPAYCLMTNHFHLVVQTPNADLAAGMHHLNSTYANYFNRRHAHVGHLFQSRYSAVVVETEPQLLETCRYVVLNPVRAGFLRRPGVYPWSSYRATAGYVPPPSFLAVAWVLSQFGENPRRAALRYVEFVADGLAPSSRVRGPGPRTRL